MNPVSSAVLCGLLAAMALSAQRTADQPGVPTKHVLVLEPTSATMLVKASDAVAVIRAGAGVLETVRVGDLVGTTKAVIKEISTGRIVLEETFTAKDGGPNLALIVIKEGERGGTRYLQRADAPPFSGTRPVPVTPATPAVVKPSPKNPGLM